ncbi:AAA family ATPase [Methylobacterium sp. J-030]|uniref:AAA family ATPase n=1 Tax=Methylobacterium sp. J-030 TaxID=2836627 RepID=UPI001FBA1321|nr:AAA family ATPase [Methylobacterium sp. J-030]MCJ2069669.1 AAA family ATPase [Methylobacterium sp. J-030]
MRTPKPELPPFAGLPDLPALRELQSRPKWVAWEYTWNDDRGLWDKPPLNAKNGGLGSTTNAATWAPYDAAAAFATQRVQAGVGYVLSVEDEQSGIDLDKCRDPETGAFQPWAQVAIDFAETYTEISPSGRGLRFFVRGLVDGRKVDAAQVEIYTGGRYLTVTGRHVPGTPTEIREAPRLIAYLQERADQIRAAQKVAADLARDQERKKAEKRAEAQAQEQPRQSTSERASASARERGPREGSDFWRTVNDRALANLSAWVTSIFPGARYQSGTGAYRVDQRDLGEGYEEDLSLHPDGIRDFGVGDMGDARDGARSPIDIVKDYLPANDPAAAAMWLCERIGARPEDLGWKGGRQDQAGPRETGGATQGTSAEAQAESLPTFKARPFVWADPATIPRREWVLERHLIRKFISVTAAPGGVGKSSLVLADGLAMATGRNLIGHHPHGRFKVLIWNGEDPLEEMQRRIMAACIQYDIGQEDIEGHLFVNSGRDDPIVIAEQKRDGVTIAVPVVEALKATIRENGIDVVQIDPFVSCHAVNENDNGAIDRVAKLWGKIADETGCAIELVHHTRKTGGNETVMEDMRGAVALLSAARSGRILNIMSGEEAERAGVEQRRLYFRVDNGKANLAPPPTDRSSWFKMASVDLGNGGDPNDSFDFNAGGDSVGVVTAWQWPDPLANVTTADLRAAQTEVRATGPWRENVQANDWVGKPIARALGLDAGDKAHREKIKRLLKIWIENGMFVVVSGTNEKGRPTPFVEVGAWAGD